MIGSNFAAVGIREFGYKRLIRLVPADLLYPKLTVTTTIRDKKVEQRFANRKSFETVWLLGKKKQLLFL